jgi:hypothetical protein
MNSLRDLSGIAAIKPSQDGDNSPSASLMICGYISMPNVRGLDGLNDCMICFPLASSTMVHRSLKQGWAPALACQRWYLDRS